MRGRFQIMAKQDEVCVRCKRKLKYRIQYYSYIHNCRQNWVCNDCICEILKDYLEGTNED